MIGENRILLADSYKATHWLQYPPGTERVDRAQFDEWGNTRLRRGGGGGRCLSAAVVAARRPATLPMVAAVVARGVLQPSCCLSEVWCLKGGGGGGGVRRCVSAAVLGSCRNVWNFRDLRKLRN